MSSSVHELRVRIGAVEDVIERQQEVLRDLERQRSNIQTELNALLDPMARLPPEISSEILLQSMSTTRTWDFMNTVLRVCRSWHDLALATPSLWSTITDRGIP
ncbi:hypothetical protein FB45DRAFT_938768 [Roridomyces roridus]|uniref:F-box domain-containing protein n=1 Tax=Roridomyces roridus TaxID=1738132 RepID=A0AAD7FDW3_9AGAR|nr:hypothetical protein FB45DRAFT_938768 [Roridomyces roridus]